MILNLYIYILCVFLYPQVKTVFSPRTSWRCWIEEIIVMSTPNLNFHLGEFLVAPGVELITTCFFFFFFGWSPLGNDGKALCKSQLQVVHHDLLTID